MRILLLGWLLLGALLAAGCVTDRRIDTRIDQKQGIPPGFGLVAVQVVSNTRQLAQGLWSWTDVNVVDLDNPLRMYRLPSYETGMRSSQVFIGALPPGRYGIYNLHAFRDTGDFQYWMNAHVPRSLGSFEVATDGITTLGTLAYQPLKASADGQSIAYFVTRVDDRQDLVELIAEMHPGTAVRSRTAGIRGWFDDGADVAREVYAQRLRELAIGNVPLRQASGRIVVPSRFGQIRWRDAGAKWQRVDTGYTSEILAVAEVDGGWIAAGERGLVLQAPAMAGPWKRIPGPSPKEVVYWLAADGNGGFYALAGKDFGVQLYRQRLGGSEWKSMRGFSISSRYEHDRVSAFVEPGGGLRVFHREGVSTLDAAGNWSEATGEALARVTRLANGSWVAQDASTWSSGIPRFSRDDARTWETLMRPLGFNEARVSLPLVLSSGRFVVPGSIETRDANLRVRKSKEIYLLGSAHRARDWRKLSALPAGCPQLVPSISTDEHWYIACWDGRLLRSDDGGKHWLIDLDPGLDRFEVPGLVPELSPPVIEA